MINSLGAALRTKGRQLNPKPWSIALALAALGASGYAVWSYFAIRRISQYSGVSDPYPFTEGYQSSYYWTISKQYDDPLWTWTVYSVDTDPKTFVYRGTSDSFQAALDAKDAYITALDAGGYKP